MSIRWKYCEECEFVGERRKAYHECECCDQVLCEMCWNYHIAEYHEEYEEEFDRDPESGDGQYLYGGRNVVLTPEDIPEDEKH